MRDITPSSGEVITVQVTELDLANRMVHVLDRNGGSFAATFRAAGAFLQIPAINEFWTAKRVGFNWHLDSRLDDPGQPPALVELNPGDIRVNSSGDIHLNPDGEVLVNGNAVGRQIVPHTFAITGEVKVPIGNTDFIPPFFVKILSGQSARLTSVRYKINGGTSVTAKLQINGEDATGFTGMSIATTADETDPTDIALANNDEIALVVTAVSGTPENLTATVFLEYGTA